MTTTPKFEPPTQREDYPRRCSVCGGAVVERTVNLSLPDPAGEIRIVHHVPAGVCESCGEQYLTSAVIRRIEKLLEAPPTRRDKIPVWDFAVTA